jgi:hypothetical protein
MEWNTVEYWEANLLVSVKYNGKEIEGRVESARFPKSSPNTILVVVRIEGSEGTEYKSFYPHKAESWDFIHDPVCW